jgi:23S rRNA (cytosine1962-C5)-methyltransferase
MNDWSDYELIDFGEGRKLERFGELVFDRPCPQADVVRPTMPDAAWRRRTLRYNADRVGGGRWEPQLEEVRRAIDRLASCSVPVATGFHMIVEPRPGGQVGVFPEQLASWLWIAERSAAVQREGASLKVLNLFAYTGGSTLAAAIAGCEVVHVDASKPAVEAARYNAERSGLADRPIRWIVEDALKFCQREVRRGNRYDAVVLDPPTYGHGPKGEEWLLERDLLPLVSLCGELTERRPKFFLLTCHTPSYGPAELAAYLAEGVFGGCSQSPRAGDLYLETADGRRLPSGAFARWPS